MNCSYKAKRLFLNVPFAFALLIASCTGHGNSFLPNGPNSAGRLHAQVAAGSDAYSAAVLADSPTAYYRLDDTGTTAADSSGHGLSGTIGTSVTTGVAGLLQSSSDTAMSFPGSKTAAGVVKVPQTTALQPTNAVSVELLLQFSATPVQYTSTVAYGNDTNWAPWEVYFDSSGHIAAEWSTTSGPFYIISSTAAQPNVTYHVVSTYDGTNARLYVNGVLVASGTKTGSLSGYLSGYGLTIGDDAGFSDPPFKGTIDEVAIYAGKALSATQVANHYSAATSGAPPPTPTPTPPPSNGYSSTVLGDSPTAYYRLDDTGTTAADSSGHGLNGTVGSSVTTGVPGLLLTTNDAAMGFPGTASAVGVVKVPQTTALQPSNAVSLEFLMRFTTTPSIYTAPVAYGNDANWAPYEVWFNNGHIAAEWNLSSGPFYITSSTVAQPNVTYHVVSTFDGTNARLYVNGALVASTTKTGTISGYLSGYGLTIGDDAGFSDPAFKGTIDEVAVYAGKALTATQVANHYSAAIGSAPPTPSPAPAYTAWPTFGVDLSREGFNPNETTLTTSNVPGLKSLWTTGDLGGAITAQPILATGVSISGTPTNVLYVGTENNWFYAINADTGAVLWTNKTLGSAQTGSCSDLPGGQFGVTGTATYDKNAGLVYVADATDHVHALNMSTGVEQWNVNVLLDPNTNTIVGAANQDHVYGALALNPNNGLLYAYTGSFCELPPWHGRIVAINPSTKNVVAAFFPGRTGSGKTGTAYCGGGIWGMGGASIDTNPSSPTFNDVFVATGNVVNGGGGCPSNPVETYPYGDAVVQLDSQLNLISFDTATLANGNKVSGDLDFGATPMLYSVSNCGAEQLSVKNKDGFVYTYGVGATGITREQGLQIGNTTSGGQFVGVPAFDPATGLVYVGNPNANGNYAHGLNAFQQLSGCAGLSLLWKASIGSSNATSQDNQAPTAANGVVYFTDGVDNKLWAFRASDGALLWNSGTTIGSPCTSYGIACGVFGAATVDGRVFVGSFNHKVYAFSP